MPGRNSGESALQRFHKSNLQKDKLSRADFTLTNGTSGERSKIAEFSTPYPLAFREGAPIRMSLVYHEGFYHNGATTAEQTHSLSLDAVDTVNTTPILAYADGTRLTRVDSAPANGEFSVDFDADTITVDQNTDVTVHAFYVARDPIKVEVWKEQPGTVGNVGQMVYDDITADLHVRDQNQDAPEFNFPNSAYEQIVPEDWKVSIYADGDAYGVDWDDADTDTSGSKTVNNLTATNAILNLPVYQAQGSVPGLERRVVQAIGDQFSPR